MVKLMRKRKTVRRPRKYVRRARVQRKLKYPDGLNLKLQHNDITVSGQTVPAALGNGLITECYPQNGGLPIYGALYNDITGAFLFRLRDSLQWNQFSTLYDRVKLNGIKIQFIPQWSQGFATMDSVGAVASQTAILPTMKVVHDYDDSTPPQTINSVWARRGRVFRLNKPFSVFIKPRIRSGVLSVPQGGGSGVIPALSIPSTFMDVASAADVAHYGLKFGIRDWNGNQDLRLKVVITYYCSFKNMLYNGAPVKGEAVFESHDLLDEEAQPCEDQLPKD